MGVIPTKSLFLRMQTNYFYYSKMIFKMISEQMIREYFEQNKCSLLPSQKRVCLPIINRMVRKMQQNIRFADISIHEGVIVNGHHRYIASLFAGITVGNVEGGRPNAQINDWKSIEVITEDWDTKAKLLIINQDDADFNGLSLEKVIEIAG